MEVTGDLNKDTCSGGTGESHCGLKVIGRLENKTIYKANSIERVTDEGELRNGYWWERRGLDGGGGRAVLEHVCRLMKM